MVPQTPTPTAPSTEVSSATASPAPEASTPTPSPAPTPASQPSTPQRRVRGNSFATEEDEALTKAWIRVSEDSIVGSDRKGEMFYKAIAEHYDITKPAWCTTRTAKSVERRIRKLLTETLSFASYVARITNAQPSGTTANDVVHLATALYNKIEITSVAQSCGPPFKHQTVWQLLKDHPKFDLLLHPPTPSEPAPPVEIEGEEERENGYGNNSEDNNESESFRRPLGRKRAKACDAKIELDAKRIKIAREALDAQKERNELLRSQQEMLLFTSQVDTTDPLVKEYMDIKRKQALDRLREQNAAQTTPETPHSDPLPHPE